MHRTPSAARRVGILAVALLVVAAFVLAALGHTAAVAAVTALAVAAAAAVVLLDNRVRGLLLVARMDRLEEQVRDVEQAVRRGHQMLGEGQEATATGFQNLARSLRRDSDHQYQQLEALLSLHSMLPPRRATPATRGWAASPDLLLALVDEVLDRRPASVLECGSGASTVWLARALQAVDSDGHVVALEHDPRYATQTREALERQGVADRATVVDAPLQPVTLEGEEWAWYDTSALAELPPVDLLLVDGPPGTVGPLARYPALPLLGRLLGPGALVVLDDASRDDEREVLRRWLAADPRLDLETRPHEKGTAWLRVTSAP